LRRSQAGGIWRGGKGEESTGKCHLSEESSKGGSRDEQNSFVSGKEECGLRLPHLGLGDDKDGKRGEEGRIEKTLLWAGGGGGMGGGGGVKEGKMDGHLFRRLDELSVPC